MKRAFNPLLAGLLAALPFSALAATAAEFELTGKVSAELRHFTQPAQFAGQDYDGNLALAAEPQFYWAWHESGDSLTFTPFLRLDQHDGERSHGDIRELSWIHPGEDWELRTGIRKVFWGVTEFQHLVDVINQTDAVEDVDGEDKLGQPMVNLSLVREWGILDLYLLPGFRERTFSGAEGRLRGALPVATAQAEYESAAAEHHLDAAIRWSHAVDIYDLGLYWFHGTDRDPKLSLRDGALVPFYQQIDQLGFDFQATLDSWLWKLEALWRDSRSERYWALQGGFEYTFYGIRDSAADLGVLLEYGWDERGSGGDASVQNDLFLGARLTLNDVAGSELLAGIGYDLDYDSRSLMIEASRRFGNHWKASVDGRFFSSDDPADPLFGLRRDDHIQLNLERYF